MPQPISSIHPLSLQTLQPRASQNGQLAAISDGARHSPHAATLPALVPDVWHETASLSGQLGWTGVAALLLVAYSQGGGTYTGLEAVSNNVNVLADPKLAVGINNHLLRGGARRRHAADPGDESSGLDTGGAEAHGVCLVRGARMSDVDVVISCCE